MGGAKLYRQSGRQRLMGGVKLCTQSGRQRLMGAKLCMQSGRQRLMGGPFKGDVAGRAEGTMFFASTPTCATHAPLLIVQPQRVGSVIDNVIGDVVPRTSVVDVCTAECISGTREQACGTTVHQLCYAICVIGTAN